MVSINDSCLALSLAVFTNSLCQAVLTEDLQKFISMTDELINNIVQVVTVAFEHVAFGKVCHVTHLATRALNTAECFDNTKQDFVKFLDKIKRQTRDVFFESVFRSFLVHHDDFVFRNASNLRCLVLKHTGAR